MTSTRKAKPLHVAIVAALLATSGGVMLLNKTHPGAEHVVNAIYRILPAEAVQQAVAPAKNLVVSAANTVESAAKAVVRSQ